MTEPRPPWERLKHGDSTAMADVITDLSSSLRLGIARILGGYNTKDQADVIDDLEQETWLRVWNCRDRYDPSRGAFKNWVFTIARNQTLNYLATERRRELLERTGFIDLSLMASVDDADPLLRIIIDELIAKVIAPYPERDREIIKLWRQGHKLRVISEMVQVPVSTISDRIRRFRDTVGRLSA